MIGETLGQYRIESRLGAGGMAVVYRARDERLHRTVALKVVGGGTGGSSPDERHRMLEEARAASHLNHPHICTVYEVGDVDGRMFIAMEYVNGRHKIAKELLHLTVPVDVRSFSVSPDGHWLLYQSRESGQSDIYVRPYPNVTEGRIKISPGGTLTPLWHPSGAILFFEGQKLVRAEVETTPAFRVTRITRLYDVPGTSAMAMAPDGRFLPMQPVTQAPPELRVILNWTAEVRAKLTGR
jgi:hypothetical protein